MPSSGKTPPRSRFSGSEKTAVCTWRKGRPLRMLSLLDADKAKNWNLKVALAGVSSPAAMVFDEVDRGVGGAVADAVGVRLQRLAQTTQVLLVTHSPQVAARASRHFRIARVGDAHQKATVDLTGLTVMPGWICTRVIQLSPSVLAA